MYLLINLLFILTQLAYIANGKRSCSILQQNHWAEARNAISQRRRKFYDVSLSFLDVRLCNVVFSH